MSQAALPNREVIRLFWDVKKSIKQEFGVSLQLSQNGIVDEIDRYVAKTRNRQLKRIGGKLLIELRALTNASSYGVSSYLVSTRSGSAGTASSSDGEGLDSDSTTIADPSESTQRVRYYRGRPVV